MFRGLGQMPMWHSDQGKKKVTGGKRTTYRTRRSSEVGGYPAETRLGDTIKKIKKTRGYTKKIKLLRARYANVTIPSTGKTERVMIEEVLENPANIDYNRRGIITRGTVIKTSLGMAFVTSRPGQDGIINAIIVSKK
jgi:small subunit ribosomal protein S8e